MNKEQELEPLKQNIQKKGLTKISDYFDLTFEELNSYDDEQLKHLYNMARLGMQFEREMNISKRSVEMNHIRIIRMIADNKEEMKKFIKRSLPNYVS